MRRCRDLPVLLFLILGAVGASAEDELPLAELDRDALATLLRTERTTPERLAALSALPPRKVGWALRFAAMDAEAAEILNVVDHALGTGVLGQMTIGYLQALVDAEVVLEGSLRRLLHPDLHVYVIELDVGRVLRGKLTLTPDTTPLRILVSAFGNHRRWILTDWSSGTRVTVFASEGEVFYESRRLIVRGLCVDGDAAWPTTGREEALVETLAPLALRESGALLASMQADDDLHRWLGTVRALWLCRNLGEPFPPWPRFGSCALCRERVEGMRRSVHEAVVGVQDRLVWDHNEDRYQLVEEEE